MAEREQVGYDVGGLFAEAVLDELDDFAEADDGVRVLPVDLVVGQRRIAAGVEDEVLLEENDEAVLDLAPIQVGDTCDGCESLTSVAREDREDPL